jgi:hypothetical protein
MPVLIGKPEDIYNLGGTRRLEYNIKIYLK